MNDGDWFGVFDQYGTWSVPNTRNLYPLNIIKPMVKANTSAVTSANIKVVVEPRIAKDTKATMVSDVCRTIRDLKTEEQWTNQLNERVATEAQVAPGVFLWTEWDPDAKSNFVSSVDEWKDDEWTEGGSAVCKACGHESSGYLGDNETATCENCGGEAEIMESPTKENLTVIAEVKQFKNGNTTTRVIPASEISIDDRRTEGGNIVAARWMLHRHLEPLDELEQEYPKLHGSTGAGAVTDWSYPLRWQYVMQTGNDQPYYTPGQWVDEVREVRDLYLTPQMYSNIKVSQPFSVGKFKIDAGKKISEGTYNGKKVGEAVLCFRTVGAMILDVYPCDFREKLQYITLLSNPSSFWGLFLTEMLPIQDTVNYMNSIQIFHTRRNARTTKVLDSGSFNAEDLEKDVVLTKEPLQQGEDIRTKFGFINSATLSQVPQQILTTQLSVAPQIGGVTPAMTGQSLPNEPAYAQRQQKEQSLTQLMPFMKSIATCKVEWTLRQLKECQANYTEEEFLYLLKINPDWTEEFIEAFLHANLDTDIIMDYERGSESPRNLLDREMALRQFMVDLGSIQQMKTIGADPQMLDQILELIKQFTQVDVDIENNEQELRVADTRSDKIVMMAEQMDVPPDTPMEQLNLIASQLASLPDLMPLPEENHQLEIDFYVDKIEREFTKEAPDHLNIACWRALINSHKQAAIEAGQEKTEAGMAVQAPAMQAQQQMAEQQQGVEQQAQQTQADAEAQKQQMEAARVQSDQEHQTQLANSQMAHEAAMQTVEHQQAAMMQGRQEKMQKKVAQNGSKRS